MRLATYAKKCGISNFNPRTPCGVRRERLQHEGGGRRNFNPRTPCGVRPLSRSRRRVILIFQSTHPLRGATPTSSSTIWTGRFQSTHPLRGATRSGGRRVPHLCHFNPRTPCGVRRHLPHLGRRLLHFNPRTPCGVRRPSSRTPPPSGHFNPRTPCGVRPSRASAATRRSKFQSTHPLRGATVNRAGKASCVLISIHAPLAGCD